MLVSEGLPLWSRRVPCSGSDICLAFARRRALSQRAWRGLPGLALVSMPGRIADMGKRMSARGPQKKA